MSRLSLVLIAAAIAAPATACKAKGGDAGSAGGAGDPSAPVGDQGGKVLEVAGQVTVAGKPLAVGDLLKPDDEITTGADGKVVIELTHNLAHWSLGPSRVAKLNTSIAWKLPRNQGNAQVVIQDMTAAGRPAERSAAEGAASSTVPSTPVAPTAEPPPPPPPTPGPASEPVTPAPKRAAAASPLPPPPPPPPPGGAALGGQMDGVAPGGLGLSGGGAGGGGAGGGAGLSGIGAGGAKGGGGGAGTGLTRGGSHSAHAGTAAPDAASLLADQEPALRACVSIKGKVAVHVAVDAAGVATTTTEGATPEVTACIKKVIATLKLPAAKATVQMTFEH